MTDIDLSGDRSRNEWDDIALQRSEEKERFNRAGIPLPILKGTNMNEQETLHLLLLETIKDAQANGRDPKNAAEEATKAFKAGLAAFPDELMTKHLCELKRMLEERGLFVPEEAVRLAKEWAASAEGHCHIHIPSARELIAALSAFEALR